MPSGNLARGVAGLWLMMAFTLSSVYSSNLKAMLIYPKVDLPFTSLKELAGSGIPAAVSNGSAVHRQIMVRLVIILVFAAFSTCKNISVSTFRVIMLNMLFFISMPLVLSQAS